MATSRQLVRCTVAACMPMCMHAHAGMRQTLDAQVLALENASAEQGADEQEGLPEEALRPLLYALTNDGSVRVRRAAMAVLKQAVLAGHHLRQSAAAGAPILAALMLLACGFLCMLGEHMAAIF